MADFVYEPTDEDHDYGGVHVNSGIPNRAFYLAAVALGGFAWDQAGKIWWRSLVSKQLLPDSSFKQFANITAECAQSFGESAAAAVRKAWIDVGVLDGP